MKEVGSEQTRTATELRRKGTLKKHETTKDTAGQEDLRSRLDRETIRKEEEVILDNITAIRAGRHKDTGIEEWERVFEGPIEENRCRTKPES